MTDIKRNRIVLTSVAVVAIIIGLLLVGGLPTSGAPTVSPGGPAVAGQNGGASGQREQFLVRDYTDLSREPMSDLPSSDWLGLVAGMVLKLGFVVALIYVSIRALRHYVGRSKAAAPAKKPLHVLGSMNLAPNRTVYLLEVARKVLVVGATPGQMSLLTEVTDGEAIEELRLLAADSPPADQFSSILSAFTRRLGDRPTDARGSTLLNALQGRVGGGRSARPEATEKE